jgi:hypothetical protein
MLGALVVARLACGSWKLSKSVSVIPPDTSVIVPQFGFSLVFVFVLGRAG